MSPSQPPVHRLTLCDVFPAEHMVFRLEKRTKAGVVAELVRRLVALGCVPPAHEESLVEAILARERAGTTALWQGLAMPNVRTSVTDHFTGMLAIDPEGVDFAAIGGGRVQVLFLLVAPLEQREECFALLGKIAAAGKDRRVVLQLAGCRSAAEVQRVLRSLEGMRDEG
jgi:mannitol/fructose-specific phosphotransferase system IIA component (Ntr-type)